MLGRSVAARAQVVIRHGRETPRVRVGLDVRAGSDGDKVVMLAADTIDGERTFLASRPTMLAWDLDRPA